MSLFHSIVSGIFQRIIENLVIVLWSILGMSLAAIAAYFTYKSFRLNKSKADQKADLALTLYHQNIRDHIYILVPFLENTVYEIPINILITNKGNISAKNVELFIDIPDEYYQKHLERSSPIADARGMKRASSEGRSEHIADIYVKMGDIPRNLTFKHTDFIFTRKPTVHNFLVPATTKDGIDVQVTVNTVYSILLTINLLYEDADPIKKTYDLSFRKGNKDELETFLLEEKKLLGKGAFEGLEGITPISVLYFNKFDEIPRPKDTPDSVIFNVLQAKQNSLNIMDGFINGNNIFVPFIKKEVF